MSGAKLYLLSLSVMKSVAVLKRSSIITNRSSKSVGKAITLTYSVNSSNVSSMVMVDEFTV